MWAFLRGMASILDIGGTAWRSPEVERILHTSDADALASDWEALGGDMRKALAKVEKFRAYTADEEPRFE